MKWLLIILIFIVSTNTIVTRHDVSEEKFLVNPQDYPNVVQLNLKDATGIVQMEGTFIHKDWIITAAHGLNSVEEKQTIKLFDSLYVIKQIVVYPTWEGFEDDIALIQLDRKIHEVCPIPLYKNLDELNKEITIVGRGWSGTGKTGIKNNDQKLRRATNRIDSTSTHWLKFRFDEPNNPNVTELEGISGPGDSGGPAFIEFEGQNFLAGISSNQLNEKISIEEGHYGVTEYYTRVSKYIEWIDDVITGKFKVGDSTFFKGDENWGFPETEIGKKATELMNAIASKQISDTMMLNVFYESFRESFDLKGFVIGISNSLVNPKIIEIKKAKKNVLIFVVQSEGKNYLIQLDADKRDDYLIGGMVYKKL